MFNTIVQKYKYASETANIFRFFQARVPKTVIKRYVIGYPKGYAYIVYRTRNLRCKGFVSLLSVPRDFIHSLRGVNVKEPRKKSCTIVMWIPFIGCDGNQETLIFNFSTDCGRDGIIL